MQSISDVPYPSLNGITEDRESAKIISSAYAGAFSELTAVLQYAFQVRFFEKEKLDSAAKTVEEIAIVEMEHLELLGDLLLRLGVIPIYTAIPPYLSNFYTTLTVSRSVSPVKMLLDDIRAEQAAIAEYRSMLDRLQNEAVAAVISRIQMDEEIHLKEFTALWKAIAV